MPENYIAFLTALGLITLAELGDKTQILMLSFASSKKLSQILLGVAIGTFFSHGLAIIIGSSFAKFCSIKHIVQAIAFTSFILFGTVNLFRHGKEEREAFKLNSIWLVLSVAFSIFVGELGDKTQLASIALSIQYPNSKLFLIIGCILGMLIADTLGIIVGIYMNKKIPKDKINTISNFVFIAFGIIGLITL